MRIRVVGNLYKGRVMKVLPGMQSAFVDIGLERDAFLCLGFHGTWRMKRD
jgi:ribonuclease G